MIASESQLSFRVHGYMQPSLRIKSIPRSSHIWGSSFNVLKIWEYNVTNHCNHSSRNPTAVPTDMDPIFMSADPLTFHTGCWITFEDSHSCQAVLKLSLHYWLTPFWQNILNAIETTMFLSFCSVQLLRDYSTFLPWLFFKRLRQALLCSVSHIHFVKHLADVHDIMCFKFNKADSFGTSIISNSISLQSPSWSVPYTVPFWRISFSFALFHFSKITINCSLFQSLYLILDELQIIQIHVRPLR